MLIDSVSLFSVHRLKFVHTWLVFFGIEVLNCNVFGQLLKFLLCLSGTLNGSLSKIV